MDAIFLFMIQRPPRGSWPPWGPSETLIVAGSPRFHVTVRVTVPLLSNGWAQPISVNRPFSSSGAWEAMSA
jgi:hypothetical protein